MSVQFFFLSFEPKRVGFEIGLITLYHLSVVIDLMRTIILLVLGTMCIAGKCNMSLLPTVLVLGNTRVYISTSNSCDMLFYV